MTCPLRNPCGLQLAPPNKAKLNLRKQQTLSEVSKRDASVGLLGVVDRIFHNSWDANAFYRYIYERSLVSLRLVYSSLRKENDIDEDEEEPGILTKKKKKRAGDEQNITPRKVLLASLRLPSGFSSDMHAYLRNWMFSMSKKMTRK